MVAVPTVDDESADDTVEVAEKAGAVIFSHGVDTRKGSAVKTSIGCYQKRVRCTGHAGWDGLQDTGIFPDHSN